MKAMRKVSLVTWPLKAVTSASLTKPQGAHPLSRGAKKKQTTLARRSEHEVDNDTALHLCALHQKCLSEIF